MTSPICVLFSCIALAHSVNVAWGCLHRERHVRCPWDLDADSLIQTSVEELLHGVRRCNEGFGLWRSRRFWWRGDMSGAGLTALAADLTERATRLREERGLLQPIRGCRRCQTSARPSQGAGDLCWWNDLRCQEAWPHWRCRGIRTFLGSSGGLSCPAAGPMSQPLCSSNTPSPRTSS